MTTIATSTASTATAYSNQRKIDRCQNGVLWATYQSGTGNAFRFAYSTDDGATWTDSTSNLIDGGTSSYTRDGSLFIDVDDYAHFVYKYGSDGFIYYRRGTPNAARTAWTWSAATTVYSTTTNRDLPDIVAHREGTGWKAHIVATISNNTSTQYYRLNITSAGAVSLDVSELFIGSYSGTVPTWPSIDFNHTGDGKTVAGNTPHLYAAWSAGATGAGKGIRFKKATYSGGSWTWGTEREIDSTRYVAGGSTWLNCLFDGTRVVLAGFVYDGAGLDLVLHERDSSDTANTPRVLLENAAASDHMYFGSSAYDGDGNAYLFGANTDETSGSRDLVYRKWTRSGASLGSEVVVDSGVGDPYVSAKRGYSDNRIKWIYTDGTSSPYSVTYGSISLNATPNVPTALTVTSDALDTTPVFSANVSDPDSSQSIKARFTIYQSDGTTVVGTVDSTLTAGSHTATKEYASALAIGNYKVAAATVDDIGAVSAQTAQVSFSVKQAVEEDFVAIWDVDALVSVDLQVQWDVLVSNQKDIGFIWNVAEQTEISLELEWSVYTPWVEVSPGGDTPPVIWEEVRA